MLVYACDYDATIDQYKVNKVDNYQEAAPKHLRSPSFHTNCKGQSSQTNHHEDEYASTSIRTRPLGHPDQRLFGRSFHVLHPHRLANSLVRHGT